MKDYTDIIYSPVITEKSALKMQNENVYTFKVAKSATKDQIKKAVENGEIDNARYERFCKIYQEIKEKEERKW